VACVKKTKTNLINSHNGALIGVHMIFCILTQATKGILLSPNLCANIKYRDINTVIFSELVAF
jgi:hypothetical protein